MLSRISEALGCPASKSYSSGDSSAPEGDNWLSQSTRDSSLFIVPTPNLREVLQTMGIVRCGSTGQFYFDRIPSDAARKEQNNNPWAVAHSSRQRCKLAELLLSQTDVRRSRLLLELRTLATNLDENTVSGSATFIDLLIPLLTEAPKLVDDGDTIDPPDDVLILFGSPATIFQLLLSVPSLSVPLTDLILELVASSSPHSVRLLEQLKQPVGLTTMFSSKKAFEETATRLLELFQVVTEPTIQASILNILPDLASSPCTSNGTLTDEDRLVLIQKLLELLATIPTSTVHTTSNQVDPVTCLIECLTSFSVDRELALRLPDALFQLLDRCYTPEEYYAYLPVITRSLLIHGPAVPRNASELTKLVQRLRNYFTFPKKHIELSGESLECALIDLLRVAFQFNRQLMAEWIHAINTSSVLHCEGTDEDSHTFHDQAAQDLLVLCVIYSVIEIHATGTTTSAPIGSRNTMLSLCCSSIESGVGQSNRLQSEAAAVARRLVTSGRLFPTRQRAETLDSFFTCHSALLLSPHHRLFSAFVCLADQLISTPSTSVQPLIASGSDSSPREVGSALLTRLFQAPACELAQRQEIVVHLIRHSLSALPDPAKSSGHGRRSTSKQKAITRIGLLALLQLARSRPHDLARFETILFGLLDRVLQFAVAYGNSTPDASSSVTGPSVSDQTFESLKETTRLIFLILAWVAFSDREQKLLQEKLLSVLRKQLSSSCLFSKALGVIGSVVVLETICRRQTPTVDPDGTGLVLMSTQYDDSIVLANQLTHVEHERASTSTTSTSRTSNTSSLSLRGPGTTLADDPDEVHVPVEDTEEDLDENQGRTRAPDVMLSAPVDRVHIPPSRLLLQLIGLVEHATSPHAQLFALWLDELCSCFTRLFQLGAREQTRTRGTAAGNIQPSPAKTPSKSLFAIPSDIQAERFIRWMGARVMRDFQDDFVVDNALLDGHQCQLNLNDPSMCEIAIAMGPTWHQYRIGLREQTTGPAAASRAMQKPSRIPNPFLLPAQLRLIGITQRARNNGRLDSIDALLGCPLLLPCDSTDSQNAILRFTTRDDDDDEVPLLLCVINWCLEVVNVFAWHVITADCVGDEVTGSFSMPCAVALARLTHIAHLRQQLYTHLHDLALRSGQMFETAEQAENGRTLNDLCLPTVTFEPGKLYTTHVSHSMSTSKSRDPQRCFACGVHFESQPKKKSSIFTRKVTNLKECKSKCATASSESKSCVKTVGPRGKKRRRRIAKPTMMDVDGDDQPSSTGSVHSSSEHEDCEEDPSSSSQQTDDDCEQEGESHLDGCSVVEGKSVPAAAGGGTGSRKGKKISESGVSKFGASGLRRMKSSLTPSPDLEELTACFRELDLAALALGLSAWPWQSQLTETGVTVSACPQADLVTLDRTMFDWVTLSWLVEDLRVKLEHLSESNSSTPTGWYAFECLDNLEPQIRSTLLLHIVPHLQRILHLALSYLKENPGRDDDLDSLCTSSSSSSEDDSERPRASGPVSSIRPADRTIPPLDQLHPQPADSSPIEKSATSLPKRVRQLIANVVCGCLSSLCILCHGSANPMRSVSDHKPAEAQPFAGWSAFNLDCVRRVADACNSSSITTTGCASRPANVRVLDLIPVQKVFVDVLLSDGPPDRCHSIIRGEAADHTKLAKNICSILQWLFDKSSGARVGGLPNIVAALFQCHFTSRLVDLFASCVTATPSGANLSDDDFRVPMELFRNTEMLLDQRWDSTVRWKNISYRDSIQGILAQHLRLTPSPTPAMYTDPESFEWLSLNHLLEFTRGVLLPRLRSYQGKRGPRNSPDTCFTGGGYCTLTRSTGELYCHEVMNAVLWYTRRLGAVGTGSKAHDESLLLSSWNECVVILCLLIDLVRPAHRPQRSRRDATDDVVEPVTLPGLLPSLMRTGRTFLEGLLKGAMPLLSTLFRYRGLEVTTLLRNTQSLTRFLQRVCTHAKAYRNARLANQIPATRRCLETFVYRVKTMLSQNQCAEAFWLGTLKNRDLHGVEIQDDESVMSSRSNSLGSQLARNSRPATRNRPSSSSSQSLRCADEINAEGDEDDSDASSSTSTTTSATTITTDHSDSVRLRHVTVELERNAALVEEDENDLIAAGAVEDGEEMTDVDVDYDDGVIEPSQEEELEDEY